jgi:hypothetical protein
MSSGLCTKVAHYYYSMPVGMIPVYAGITNLPKIDKMAASKKLL